MESTMTITTVDDRRFCSSGHDLQAPVSPATAGEVCPQVAIAGATYVVRERRMTGVDVLKGAYPVTTMALARVKGGDVATTVFKGITLGSRSWRPPDR